MRYQPAQKPGITVNTDFNPFDQGKSIAASGWQKLYENSSKVSVNSELENHSISNLLNTEEIYEHIFQMGPYIISTISEGLLIVDATSAHERILFQKYSRLFETGKPFSQQSLFPQTITFSTSDFQLIQEFKNEFRALGFDLQEFGQNSYAIQGIPTDIKNGKEKELLESLLDQLKHNSGELISKTRENLSRSMARNIAIRKNSTLSKQEMKMLFHELKSCTNGDYGLDGKPCMILLKTGDLADRFR